MTSKKIAAVRNLIKKECEELGFVEDWFFGTHLLAVEKFARELLKKLPSANAEVVLLSVWLHDVQRVRGLKGDHVGSGAKEACKILSKFGYSKEIIEQVRAAILSHSCNTKLLPKSVEGKILASADAMSHYVNDLYLTIAVSERQDLAAYKKWALEKLDRDYHKKIFFGFAKKMIQKRHEVLKEFMTMK
ncbi:MAG: HD domain-containing protein [bacterium]